MKQILLPLLSLLAFTGAACATGTIAVSTKAPTVGGNDISAFASSSTTNSNDYSDKAGVGESFLTGSSVVGYDLNSVTVQGGNNAGGGYQSDTFALAIYTVNTTNDTLTYVGGEDFTFPTTTGSYASDYLTFTLATPLALAANTEYAYTLNRANAAGGYFGFAGTVSGTMDYSGGTAVYDATYTPGRDPNNYSPTTTSYAAQTYNQNFDIDLSAAPEPQTWGMIGLSLLGLFFWDVVRQKLS